jgi:secreted trypsin-like serine protease
VTFNSEPPSSTWPRPSTGSRPSCWSPPALCAGRTNLDTCQGDSGGPLFFEAVGGGFIQAGITSWGIGCGAAGFPGVYTRLSNRGVGNFILSATGGVPVNSAQAA